MATVTIYRGDTWRQIWEIRDDNDNPIPLPGASARLHVRALSDELILSASTADGKMVLSPLEGRIVMDIPIQYTDIQPGLYMYDCEITYQDGSRLTIEQAHLEVLRDISKD